LKGLNGLYTQREISVVNVMGPTFEPDYAEKYRTFLLASRIVSDALVALLLVRSGRRDHPKVGNVLKEVKDAMRELAESKDAPAGPLAYAFLQVVGKREMDELLVKLNKLQKILECSEEMNEEAYKHLSDYLVNLAEKLHPLIPAYAALTS
jgi:signal transduction histidine kinase